MLLTTVRSKPIWPPGNPSMNQVKVRVMDNPLIFTMSKEVPEGAHRIGSVTVDFKHGDPIYVRIYGSVRIFTSGKERNDFEVAVRKYCENPAVLEQLFDYTGSWPTARRFNPSQVQKKKRQWYQAGKEPALIH